MVKKGYLSENRAEAERARLRAIEVVLDMLKRELKASPTEPKQEPEK
jgi:hypothetical protein